jgi:Regulator of G protein signaling domain/Domain found in Dishevelled, Egl-10, and Pleckstrin (DEP)
MVSHLVQSLPRDMLLPTTEDASDTKTEDECQREAATMLLERLRQAGMIFHVEHTEKFKDGKYYYRLLEMDTDSLENLRAAAYVVSHAMDESKYFAIECLREGTWRMSPTFAIIEKEDQLLYFYRSCTVNCPEDKQNILVGAGIEPLAEATYALSDIAFKIDSVGPEFAKYLKKLVDDPMQKEAKFQVVTLRNRAQTPANTRRILFPTAAQQRAFVAALVAANVTLRESNSSDDETKDSGADLTLEAVLQTPQLKHQFRKYLEAKLCAESIHFLDAVQSYRSMPTELDRGMVADRMFSVFVDPTHATEQINIAASTRSEIESQMNDKKFPTTLFDSAEIAVMELLRVDIFRRFVASQEYQEMLDAKQEGILRDEAFHRRPSFNTFPLYEDYQHLDDLKKAIEAAGLQQDRMYLLKKYKNCIFGKVLVDWLVQNEYISTRAGAVAYGQRLVDAWMLHHVADAHEFEDDYQVFRFRDGPPVSGPDKIMSAKLVPDAPVSGFLMLQGVLYCRMYCSVSTSSKTFYAFRSRSSEQQLFHFSLKRARCTVIEGDAKDDFNDMSTSYLTFTIDFYVGGQNKFTFRLPSSRSVDKWVSVLEETGVSLKFRSATEYMEAEPSVLDL